MTMLRKILALCYGRLAPAGSHPPRIRPLKSTSVVLEFRRHVALTLGTPLKKITTLLRMHKRVERDLDHVYRLMVRNAPDGIFIVDGDLKFVEVNDPLCRMWGMSRKEILTQSLPEILAEVDCEQDFFCDLLARAGCRGEMTLNMPDDTCRILELQATPLQNDLFMGLARDITERAQREGELRRAAEWRALLLRSLNEGLAIIDREGRILLCNRAFETMLELPSQQLQEVSLLKPFWQSVQRECLWSLCSLRGTPVFGAENPFHLALHLQQRVTDCRLKLQPHDKILSINAGPLYDEHNALIGAAVTLRDISASFHEEQKQKTANLRRQQYSCLAAQRTLAGEIVKQIEDPTSGIALYAQMLRDNASQTSEEATLVRGILQETHGLLETIRELRAMSKSGSKNGRSLEPKEQRYATQPVLDMLAASAWPQEVN